jgi:hypothetical protein
MIAIYRTQTVTVPTSILPPHHEIGHTVQFRVPVFFTVTQEDCYKPVHIGQTKPALIESFTIGGGGSATLSVLIDSQIARPGRWL